MSMSDKSLTNYPLRSVAMTGNITSDPLAVQNFDDFGFEVAFSGAPSGTFSVEVSNSKINWQTVPLYDDDGNVVSPQASGGPANHWINLNQINGNWLRLNYNFLSGSGTLDVWATGKNI